jgi:hypothetical protein
VRAAFPVAELLKVLEKPELPLHNNASEQDIREFVKKRKMVLPELPC